MNGSKLGHVTIVRAQQIKRDGDIQMELDQELRGQNEGIFCYQSVSVSKLIGFVHPGVVEILNYESSGPRKFCGGWEDDASQSCLHIKINRQYSDMGFTQVTARGTNIKSLVTNHKKTENFKLSDLLENSKI